MKPKRVKQLNRKRLIERIQKALDRHFANTADALAVYKMELQVPAKSKRPKPNLSRLDKGPSATWNITRRNR